MDYFDLLNKDKYNKRERDYISSKANKYILIEESFMNNVDYTKMLLLVACFYEDVKMFKMIYKSGNHIYHLLASLVMLYGYKIVFLDVEDVIDDLIDFSRVEEREELIALYRNANYKDRTSHPLLLPLLYVRLFNDIITGRSENILDRNIVDIMNDVGMINVTSKDNYDYYFENIGYYNNNTKPDSYYLRDNKVYYRNRAELNAMMENEIYFIPGGKYKKSKGIIAKGTFDDFKLVTIDECLEINNVTLLCNIIKLLKNFYEGRDLKEHISRLRAKIRELYSHTLPEIKYDLDYCESLMFEGMRIRGWSRGNYPTANQLTNYKCYMTDKIRKINIKHAYDYYNNVFIYYGDTTNVTNPQTLSRIYIATAVFYMMNKFSLFPKNFSISTMI